MKLQIVIDGIPYEVEVENAGDALPPESTPAANPIQSSVVPSAQKLPSPINAREHVDEGRVCRSPIAGIVIRVHAHAGDVVRSNDPIFLLEAMKMETIISAPIAGKIKSLKVSPGDAVKLNQILADFE